MPPGVTEVVAGDAEIVKSGTVTVSPAEAECVKLPLVPVTLKFPLLAALPAAVLMVNVVLPGVAIELEVKEGVAPLGKPLAARFTVPENPFSDVVLTV